MEPACCGVRTRFSKICGLGTLPSTRADAPSAHVAGRGLEPKQVGLSVEPRNQLSHRFKGALGDNVPVFEV